MHRHFISLSHFSKEPEALSCANFEKPGIVGICSRNMKTLAILALLLMTVIVYGQGSTHKSPNLIGGFDAKDGATCKMLKLDMGQNSRAVLMECTCKDLGGPPLSYACSYYFEGDFEKCPEEEKIYRQVERGLAGIHEPL